MDEGTGAQRGATHDQGVCEIVDRRRSVNLSFRQLCLGKDCAVRVRSLDLRLTPARPLLVWQVTMLARLISSAACSSLGRGATAAVPRALVPCSTSFAAAWRAEQPAALTRTIKTHAGTKKRFSVTKSGKVKCYKNGKSHLAQSKNRKRMLRLGKTNFLEGPQAKMIKTILGK